MTLFPLYSLSAQIFVIVWIWVGVGLIRVPVPDPGWMFWHDAHHVALGVGTDLRGEAWVSAVDLRGRPPSVLIALLSVGALGLAFCRWPGWTLRCWRASRGLRTLYRVPRERLRGMTVAEARAEMGIAEVGIAEAGRLAE